MPDTPATSNSSEPLDSASPKHKSEAEIQRERNIRERDAFFKSFMKEPDFAEAVEAIGIFSDKENTVKPPKPKIRRSKGDSAFKYFGNITIPVETRKSLRLLDKEPLYNAEDLVDDNCFKRKRYHDDEYDYTDLEEVVYRPRKIKIRSKNTRGSRTIIAVEEVTEAMIKKVAMRVSVKQYSSMGSSCHQCRQKTLDQKTCCRNDECFGVRGQFCGVCLFNRYGENATDALRDPNWKCPVCRGICNCSFCRAKEGKRPTGILTPLAHQNGHKSVKDFLESLNGRGDYIEKEEEDDLEDLLGFTADSKHACSNGGALHVLDCAIDHSSMRRFFEDIEDRLECHRDAVYSLIYGENGVGNDSVGALNSMDEVGDH